MDLADKTGALVVAGCDDGLMRVWDLEARSQCRPPLRAGTDGVTAVATGTIDGKTALVTTGHLGPVRTRWLDSGDPVGPPVPGTDPVAVGRVHGTLVVVAANERDDRMGVWDPTTAHSLHASRHHDAPPSALTVAELGDRQVVVSGDSQGRITVSDLTTGQLVVGMAGAHGGSVGALVTTVVEGRPVVVSGGNDGTVRRWHLTSGAPLGEPLRGHRGPLHAPGRIHALAVVTSDDGPAAVSSGWDGELWVWDLARGQRIGEPLDDGYGDVQALAVRRVGGRQVVVGGGIDEPVLRVWDLPAMRLERVLPGDAHVLALAALPSGSDHTTVAGDPGRGDAGARPS
jgi:WD40 repeat protein